MLARKSLSKKKIIILSGTLMLVWGIIGVVVYRNFVPKTTPAKVTPIVLPVEPMAGTLPTTTKFDLKTSTEILRMPALVNLKIFGEVPLEVTTLGRENPFAEINP